MTSSIFQLDLVYWLFNILFGAFLGALFTLLVAELLPDRTKYRLTRAIRGLKKTLRPPTIKTSIVLQSGDLQSKDLKEEEFLRSVRDDLERAGLQIASMGKQIQTKIVVGGTEVQCSLRTSAEPEDSDNPSALTSVEIVLTAACRYRGFETQLLEMSQAPQQIEEAIRYAIPDYSPKRMVICELRSPYRLSEVLAGSTVQALYASLEDGTRVDLTSSKMIVHSQLITANVVHFLREMIVFYC